MPMWTASAWIELEILNGDKVYVNIDNISSVLPKKMAIIMNCSDTYVHNLKKESYDRLIEIIKGRLVEQ